MTKDVNNFPFIETNRLLLREIVKEDANDILKYLSDEEVMKYYGLAPFKTINEALNEIYWYQSILNEQTGIRWGITLKEKDEVIGSCGFLNRVPGHYRTEIGYELSRDYWGHGIASEALEAVIRYGFKYLKFQRIEALVEPPNIPSQKLIEKNGFIREGLLRNYEFTCGEFDDLYMYSLLKQDFEKLQESKLNM
ncbi:GNAT family N-acetyltransferase [Priestia filamentosa]|uniref:GNAT family N-acetyltransferase n=1 Tax=Priestia filamentosa TaxID=1402861 RepID=UPI001FB43DF9|nr:GNAT family protein [Priestia filamentosa]UOE59264.1 GNAT family N-acetyltransferase [Priestia filamentosa]